MKTSIRTTIFVTLVSLFSLLQSPAQAAIELELTQGIESALPIAVLNFQQDKQLNIADIIATDLKNSGQFRVVNKLSESPKDAVIDYSLWRGRGAENVISGKVKALGADRFEISFELLDALRAQHLVLGRTFTVTAKDLRRLAHHISDLIYKQLTGERGVFLTHIAYILVQRKVGTQTRYQLEVADYDGKNPLPLLTSKQPILSPSWSPDGKQIAYVSFENKRSQVFIVNVATGKRRLITDYRGINGAPAWSPDGKELAVVLSRSGHAKIYRVNLSNDRVTQVTHGSSIDTEPSWSRDGRSILFTSSRGGSPQIYKVNLASKAIERVTFNGTYNARASFTANARNIILLHRNGGLFNIAVQDVLSGRVNVLTTSGRTESPSASPNSRFIIYATKYGSEGVLSMVSIDGRVKLRLPSRDGDVQEPVWSPYLG